MKRILVLLTAAAGLAIAATMAQAGDIRWHIYPDNSVLLDDDRSFRSRAVAVSGCKRSVA
jgi:hypothetical protein